MSSDEIECGRLLERLPTDPKQGDVIEWWTMQHHPGLSYVQRHRATYYQSAACADVLGKSYSSGKPFRDEWHVETWYEPTGSKTPGGRIPTIPLQCWLATGPQGGSMHATWEGARDAAAANMRKRAAEFKSMAMSLEQEAAKLEETPPPEDRP